MNKKGSIGDWILAFFIGLVVIIVFGIPPLLLIGVRDIGSTEGTHTGVITAVEYRGNIIWDENLVYVKTDAQSTQEDKYCVNDLDVKKRLSDYSTSRDHVKIYYSNDKLMWAWECNTGESIIYKVEKVG